MRAAAGEMHTKIVKLLLMKSWYVKKLQIRIHGAKFILLKGDVKQIINRKVLNGVLRRKW